MFWSEPSVSTAPILVTANFVWSSGETHPDDHRNIISRLHALEPGPVATPNDFTYDLADRYMTVRKYDGGFGFDRLDILNAEKKTEIPARSSV